MERLLEQTSETPDEDPRRNRTEDYEDGYVPTRFREDGPIFDAQHVSKGKRRTPDWERGFE
ncbi:hypothetical protein [Natronobacterium gregoryi]|nr:hypothetical protein [Natronobacterium gregoryi]